MKERGVEGLGNKIPNKKAVSPVVTTILLVLLVIILAAIIVVWGIAFIPEVLTKFDRPIDEKCTELVFSAELSGAGNEIVVSNEGNIPIYRFDIRKEGKTEATKTKVQTQNQLLPGDSLALKNIDTSGMESGDELDVIPVLLGKTKKNKIQEYPCSEQNWKIITIQ